MYGCAIILAAGSSARMGGFPKQLLKLKDFYLLEIVIQKVLSSSFEEVLVILGYKKENIIQSITISDSRVKWITNDEYWKGQSTSFLTAIQHVPNHFKSVVFFLGDQPFICPKTIEKVLVKGYSMEWENEAPFVVRPSYNSKLGHPVFIGNFRRINFSYLSGDQGGKIVLQDIDNQEVLPVDDPNIHFDIDTMEDYKESITLSKTLF